MTMIEDFFFGKSIPAIKQAQPKLVQYAPLIGKDGNADKELLNLSDDNFMKALEEGDGKVTFEIPEGLYQDIRIICDDQAFYGDHENILYDEMFTNVSVTPNGFLIFWANKPLRYGILGGVVLLVAGIVALIIMKKRKKKTPVAKSVF